MKQVTQSILITGRRWFDKYAGNTYFSAKGYVDGAPIAHIPYSYGYGDHYVDMITDELERQGYMPDRKHYENGGAEPGWQYFRDNRGILWNIEATDVSRKRDL